VSARPLIRWLRRSSGAVALTVGVFTLSAGVLSMALIPGHSSQRGDQRAVTRSPAARSPAALSSALPALGVYAGAGAAAGAENVDRLVDGKVTYALDFLSEASWTSIDDPNWLAAQWKGSPFKLVIGVPMMPASGASLAQGATGAYDAQFLLLAQRLVADGLSDAVLMIGWQPEDQGQPWDVGSATQAAEYVRYWDEIHTTMAAVPGASFVYEWDAGDGGYHSVSPSSMYPGNAAVDVVATDAFDLVPVGTPAATQWPVVLNERYGPAWMESFAVAHDKPMALAMWGVVPLADGGGGDDPTFISRLLAWASSRGTQMCVLWDEGSWALTGEDFPAAKARLVGIAASSEGRSTLSSTTGSVRDASRTGVGRGFRTLGMFPPRRVWTPPEKAT